MNKSDNFLINIKLKKYFFLLLALFSYFAFINISSIHADEFHYINEMVGERAGGMGGAFTAISDDPSGAFYNPAGLAFAYENQISLSVNTVRYQRNKYSDVVGGQDYSVDYQSLFPSFFGVVQTLGPGKFAVSVVINNADLAEQYEFISNISTTALEDNFISLTYDLQDQTTLFGPSYSLQISDTFTMGLSLYGLYRRRKSINNQITQKNPDTDNPTIYPFAVINTNDTKVVKGLVTTLGFQFMPGSKVSIGAKGSLESIFSQKEERHYSQKMASIGASDSSDSLLIMGNHSVKISDYQYAMDYAVGAAFFLSKSFVLSADVKINPAKDIKVLVRDLNVNNDNFGYVNNDLKVNEPRYLVQTTSYETVINGALGMEYYATPNFPIRLGAFTNFANTKKLSSTATSGEHIDFYGGTLGLAWQTSNSSISLTSMFQYGTGKSFKYDAVKDATSIAYSFSLTGSSKY